MDMHVKNCSTIHWKAINQFCEMYIHCLHAHKYFDFNVCVTVFLSALHVAKGLDGLPRCSIDLVRQALSMHSIYEWLDW